MKFDKILLPAALALLTSLCMVACTDNPVAPVPIPVPHESPPSNPPSSRPQGAPPPISGGTLLVARDGHTAVAADPDRDRMWIVDLQTQALKAEVVLNNGDEPGRLAEDAARRIHVVLRGGGSLATIDLATGILLSRRSVCVAPRGVAYDPGQDVVYVACATGELVTLPASGGSAVRTLHVESDLRDVMVQAGKIFVSRFRAAELLQLDGSGHVVSRQAPVKQPGREAVVAWRSLALPSGAVAMLHQRAQASAISIKPGGYGHSSSNALGTVTSAVTVLASTTATTASGDLAGMALAVDVAVSADGTKVALAAPAGAPSGPAVFLTSMSEFTQAKDSITAFDPSIQLKASAVAVAFDGQGRLIVQTREPAALYISSQAKPIALPGVSRYDLGHSLFHRATSVNLACASCHPEAGEDGRVWNFEGTGLRRTQTLRGGILATLPFHWNGDFKTFASLLTEVFTNRMSGPQLSAEEANAMAQWLNAQPAPAVTQARDPAAAERGQALFASKEVGCTGCHNGPLLTNNQTVDVGTGGLYQVPWLIGLAARAPFLHNGCAATVRERFGPCGGGDLHGHTSQLRAEQIGDLVSFLETL